MYSTPDLCDQYADDLQVVAPMFRNFAARRAFGGEIVTLKCYEDNSLVAEQVEQPGRAKVLVVDGGGSMRCALVGDNLASKASQNGWEGIVVYGCVRDVEILAGIDIGLQALGANPMRSIKRKTGVLNEVVNFGGVRFIPRHFIYADDNGVVVSQRKLPV